MNRNNILSSLEVSENTFRKWCRAHDIPTNKAEYDKADLAKLQDCKDAMASGIKWRDYLESIGKQLPQQTIGDNLINRYGGDIDSTADAVSDRLIEKLDVAVTTKFAKKLAKPSSIFSKVLTVLYAPTPKLGSEADALYFLEGEILDADLTEDLTEEFPEAG